MSDEQLSLKHLWFEDDDVHGPVAWCGKAGHKLDICNVPEEVTCYNCLDTGVNIGKQCAERLTELPARVS